MCCESKGHHSQSCSCGCSCGCGSGYDCGCGRHSRLGPAFWTNEEKIAWLEEYLESLHEDAKKIKERIDALKEAK